MRQRRDRPGRRAKYTEEEVRARMIAHAKGELFDQGLGYGLDSVRLDRICVLADVPRGAAYNAFSSGNPGLTPQANLRRATIISILRETPGQSAGPTYEFAIEQMSRHSNAIASGDPIALRRVRSEMVRTVAAFNHQLLQSAQWRVYRSLVVTASTNDAEDTEILAAASSGEEALVDAYSSMFRDLASAFDLTLRPGLTHRHFAMAVYSLNEGLANRISPPFRDQEVSIEGETEPWSLFALAFDAIVDRFYVFGQPS